MVGGSANLELWFGALFNSLPCASTGPCQLLERGPAQIMALVLGSGTPTHPLPPAWLRTPSHGLNSPLSTYPPSLSLHWPKSQEAEGNAGVIRRLDVCVECMNVNVLNPTGSNLVLCSESNLTMSPAHFPSSRITCMALETASPTTCSSNTPRISCLRLFACALFSLQGVEQISAGIQLILNKCELLFFL